MDLLKAIKDFDFSLTNSEDQAREVLRIASVKDIQRHTGLAYTTVYKLAAGKRPVDQTNMRTVKKLANYYDEIRTALLASREE